MLKRILPKSAHLFLGVIAAGLLSPQAYADSATLNGVVRQAILTNPKVLAAKENRLSIDQAINQARSGFFPQIKLVAFYGPENSTNANTIAAVINNSRPKTVNMTVRQVGLTAEQMLYDGGATSGEVKRNIARANSAAYQMLVAMQDTAIAAIQAYADILHERQLVAIAERNVNAHNSYLNMIGDRTKHGLSNRADLIQIQGRLGLAESNLAAERSNLNDAITRYVMTVGEQPPEDMTPLPDITAALPQTVEEAMTYSTEFNPVIRYARADMAAAYQQREVAKAPNFPRFDLALGLDRNANVGGTRGPDNDQYAYLRMSYDIYTGGAIVGRQRETDHLLVQAREIMLNAYRQARQDTRFIWSSLTTSRRIQPILESYANSTGNTIHAYKEQFSLSKRSLLDLLDVQNEEYAAWRSRIDNEWKIKVAEYQLLHRMGKLIQTMDMPIPLETYIYVFPPRK